MTNQEYEVIHSTDWLGVNLVFYNLQSGEWSPDLNEVIDHTNIVFNVEGLQSYLLNGFVMFGLTPNYEFETELKCCFLTVDTCYR